MRRILAAALLGLAPVLLLAPRSTAHAQTPGPACPSKVMAFYYGWYGGSPAYRHWANSAPGFVHDPNHITATGPAYPGGMRRDITSTDYPVLGPYDSQSAAVIDQHLTWAARAGIDVLISSWWGPGGYEDRSLGLLLDRIEATHSNVRASVYLETWGLFHGHNFQPDFFADPRNWTPDSRAQIRATAASWLTYLLRTYANRPGLFHTVKGTQQVPVVFVYSAALFAPPEWQDIFARVRAATGIDAYYQADVEGVDFDGLASVFDGLHLYTPVPLTLEGDLSLAARVLNPHAAVRNPAASATDAVTIGADYTAWSQEARALGKSWAATVIPGFDDRDVRNPSFVVSRDHGGERTYDFFWREALSSRPDWVLVTSFNEWHEGTEIEPSVEYSTEFITRTAAQTARVRSCSTAVQADPAPANPPPATGIASLPVTAAPAGAPAAVAGASLFAAVAGRRNRRRRLPP